MKTPHFNNEDEVIQHLKKWLNSPSAPFGIGDDAAFLKPRKGKIQTFMTDFIVENVDFKKGDDFFWVGRKALAINLSDCAAMGAWPRAALLYLGFPPRVSKTRLKRLAEGIRRTAKKYNVPVIGGDLSNAPHWMIGFALVGERKETHQFLRSEAKAGESLWVTGRLGGSLLGKHFRFSPRLEEAQFLAKRFPVSACIDLSDGLSQDLNRLLRASHKGVIIDCDKIPIAKEARKLARQTRKEPLEHALQDGEDFELLFTLPARCDERLPKEWNKKFKTPLTKIGKIQKGVGISIASKEPHQRLRSLFKKGFDHVTGKR